MRWRSPTLAAAVLMRQRGVCSSTIGHAADRRVSSWWLHHRVADCGDWRLGAPSAPYAPWQARCGVGAGARFFANDASKGNKEKDKEGGKDKEEDTKKAEQGEGAAEEEEEIPENLSEEEYLQLKKTAKESTKKVKELQDKLMRCLAEQENARVRYQREVENANKYGISKFASAMLDVADSLELATDHIDEGKIGTNEELKQIYNGVKLTEAQMHKAFDNFDIEKYTPMGERFDPSKHEALFEVEDATKHKGTVVHVLKSGYRIKERVLRPAKVGTSKGGPPPPKQEEAKQ